MLRLSDLLGWDKESVATRWLEKFLRLRLTSPFLLVGLLFSLSRASILLLHGPLGCLLTNLELRLQFLQPSKEVDKYSEECKGQGDGSRLPEDTVIMAIPTVALVVLTTVEDMEDITDTRSKHNNELHTDRTEED